MAIHHYTSIETLALIIKSKSIRFNRTDKVDDAEEAKGISPNISKYVFISCWTQDDKESIALWEMYASIDNGVRISFNDPNIFKWHESNLAEHVSSVFGITPEIRATKTMKLNLRPEQVMNSDYIATELVLGQPIPFREVIYVPDKKEFLEKDYIFGHNDTVNYSIPYVGAIKSDYWEFQKESRFVIQAFPHNFKGENNLSRMNKEEDLTTDFIDVGLSDEALNTMTITLSPLISSAREEIVNAILTKYHNAIVKQSVLKGKINK